MDAAGGKQIPGSVGYAESARQRTYASANAGVGSVPQRRSPTLPVSKETLGLLSLGYPLWPLSVLALLDPKKSPFVRRHALQSLALNFGVLAMWIFLTAVSFVPWLGITAWPLHLLLFPLALVADVVYGFMLWNGTDVRVPMIADWLDERDAKVAANPYPRRP